MSRSEIFDQSEYVFFSLPPEYSKTLDPCVENVLQVLSDDLAGVVINNYDSLAHLNLLNLVAEKEMNMLKIRTIGNHKQRLLWFHPDGYIVNVRICEQDDVASLKQEIIHSREDLKLLKYLFNNDLRDKNIFITFLIIAKNISVNELSQICVECKHNIVVKEAFEEPDALCLFLQHIQDQNINPSSIKDIVTSFKCIISQLLACISSADDKSRPYLPLLRGAPDDRLGSLILNQTQMEIVRETSKHKVVTGCFGGGKSIVGQVMLRQYCEAHSENERSVVYYIVWDPWSLLSLQVQEWSESFVKRKESQNNNLKIRIVDLNEVLEMLDIRDEVSLSELLQGLINYHKGEQVYAVVDEYVSDSSTYDFLNSLDIYTTILVQPMDTCMEDHNDLEISNTNSTDLSLFTLTEGMRTSSNVSRILSLVQNLLENVPTLYRDERTVAHYSNVSSSSTKETMTSEKKMRASSRSEIVEEATTPEGSTSKKEKVKFTYQLQYHTQDKLPGKSDVAIRLIPHYIPIKHLGSAIFPNKLPVFYEWPTCDGELIEETLGPIIILNEIFLNFQKQPRSAPVTILINNIQKMAVIDNLLEILIVPKMTRKIRVKRQEEGLASIKYNRLVLHQPFLKDVRLPPSKQDKLRVYKSLNDNRDFVLVTDIRSFRGLECNNIVVLTDGTEHQGRIFIAECIARCTSNQLCFVNTIYNNKNTNKMEASDQYQTLDMIFDKLKLHTDIIKFERMDIPKHILLKLKQLTEQPRERENYRKIDFSTLVDWNR